MKLLRFALIPLMLLLLAAGGATVWLLTHEEEVEALVLGAIADGLQTDAHVTDLTLSWWSSFPQVTVELQDVWLAGSDDPETRLLRAAELALDFDALRFARQEFVVSKVRLTDAEVDLRWVDGAWNVAVWSPSSDKGGEVAFQIDRWALQRVSVQIHSPAHTAFLLTEARGQLNLGADGTVRFTSDGEGELQAVPSLPAAGPLAAHWQLEGVVSPNGDWALTVSEASIERTALALTARQQNGSLQLDGTFSGLGQRDLTKAWPDWTSAAPDLTWEHRLGGRFTLTDRAFTLDATAPNAAWAQSQHQGTASATLNLSHRGNQWRLSLPQIALTTPGLRLTGKASCEDLGGAAWAFDMEGNADAALLAEAASDWLPEALTLSAGTLDARLSGTLAPGPSTLQSLSGDIDCAHLVGAYGGVPVKVLSARCEVSRPDAVAIPTAEVEVLGQRLRPAINWMGRDLYVDLRADALDLPTKWPAWPTAPQRATTPATDAIALKRLRVWAGTLKWQTLGEGVLATDLFAEARPADGSPWHLDLNARIADGTLALESEVTNTPSGDVQVTLDGQGKDLNLPVLFATFRDFGQTTLQSHHLRGELDLTGTMACRWNLGTGLVAESLNADFDLSAEDVRLDNVEAFQEVAEYLRENRLMAPLVDPDDLAARLRNIEIAACETPVTLAGGDVRIPPLEVHSSAMDIEVAGGQTWAGALDYTLGFALRDLKNSREDAFGQIEDDGLGHRFFLTIGGTLDEPAYGWDRAAGKAARKERLEAEKNALRQMFQRN